MSLRKWTRPAEPELLTVAQFLGLSAQDNGTILRVQLDAATGKNVDLRFRSGSPNAYKWEVVGSPPSLYAQAEAAEAGVGDNAPRLMATPTISLPLAGLWEWDWQHMNLMGTSASAGSMIATRPGSGTGTGTLANNPGNPAVAPADNATWGAGFATGTGFGAFYGVGRHDEFVIAGTPPFSVTLRYSALNHTPTFYNKWMKARPIAVVGP